MPIEQVSASPQRWCRACLICRAMAVAASTLRSLASSGQATSSIEAGVSCGMQLPISSISSWCRAT
jgi:hypothetical protein